MNVVTKKLTEQELNKKRIELEKMEEAIRLRNGLPHLFGFPFYKWSRTVFESTSREILLTSANQVGKSSSAIRKNIHLATNPRLWPKYWPSLRQGQLPGLFWYMYPAHAVATSEVEQKWVKEFLPRGEFKEHPQFGWELEYHKNEIHAIHFKTGVTIQFKSYSQKARDLQTASVYHLTCDEEVPVELLPELSARLNATNGYFLTVFTATLGQDHWRKAMEPLTRDEETHKDALKIQVSLFDSMTYEDGSPSPWTKEKINRAIANCPTEAEVQRRVYGKFVKAEGLMFEGFTQEKNVIDPVPIPKLWHFTSGVDPGTGGKSGHPAAMTFIAVNPNYREGIVFRGWRGDGISTTSEDILDKHKELKSGLDMMAQAYDYAAKDFFLIASRAGESFSPADKGRERGVALLNTLFKSGMLKIFRNDPELSKLISELSTLSVHTKKTVAVDDFVDSLRYAAMAVPWDFSGVEINGLDKEKLVKEEEEFRLLTDSELRREWNLNKKRTSPDTEVQNELDYWDDLY